MPRKPSNQSGSNLRWMLAPGVRLEPDGTGGGWLVEEGLGERHPVNASAQAILELCSGTRTVSDMVEAVARRFRAAPAVVEVDTRQLLLALNGHDLVQPVRYALGQERRYYLLTAARLLGWPAVPVRLRYRLPVNLDRMAGVFRQTVTAVLLAWRLPVLLAMPGVLVLAALAPTLFGFLPVAVASLMAAAVVHEYSHLAMARWLGWRGKSCYLAISPGQISVVRRRGAPWQEVLVGVGGPVLATLPGLLIWLTGPPWPPALVFALVFPFLGQAATILPFFDDNPWYRSGWLPLASRLRERMKEVKRVMGDRVLSRGRWLRATGRGVVGFVSGMVLTYVLLLMLGSVVALLGDAAGWSSFGVSLGGLSFYRFHAGAGGEFYGELGSGIFFLALVTGLLNAAALIRRGERQTPAGRQGA